jgi:hypothetical protein
MGWKSRPKDHVAAGPVRPDGSQEIVRLPDDVSGITDPFTGVIDVTIEVDEPRKHWWS